MTGKGTPDRSAGVLLVDKSAGPTSHDVVVRAREALDIRRIGHTGTLDPFATGLLLLCVGSATRLVEYLHLLPKRYDATLRLGVQTSTHDPTGEITDRSEAWRGIGEDEIGRALERHTGRLRQRPPAYSAVRVGGERAFRAAREGRPLELEPREVEVHALELRGLELPELRISARVGTGTYIRALARDIGRDLGAGAHLRELRRTRIGPFDVSSAIPLEKLGPGVGADLPPEAPDVREPGTGPEAPASGAAGVSWWRSPAAALDWLPARGLTEEEVEKVVHGARIPRGEIRGATAPPPLSRGSDGVSHGGEELPVVLLHDGRLVAVGELEGERIQPRKVFRV